MSHLSLQYVWNPYDPVTSGIDASLGNGVHIPSIRIETNHRFFLISNGLIENIQY